MIFLLTVTFTNSLVFAIHEHQAFTYRDLRLQREPLEAQRTPEWSTHIRSSLTGWIFMDGSAFQTFK